MRDLQWILQLLKSETIDIHSISFFHSQPTSIYHHQETENSINISISRDEALPQFSQLLKILTMAEKSLRNLEFHLVEWDLQSVQDLHTLLETKPNINRLLFRRNKFNAAECLLQLLSDSLRKSKFVKEITISESAIGSYGAALLASALKENESIQELQIWEDSIGSKGAEEISKMIEVNSTLKLLTVFDRKLSIATPLISAVLARNRSMEVHIWNEDVNHEEEKVVEFDPQNGTLRIYHLDISGACRVACALGWNSTVKSLDMRGVRLNSRWAKEFRSVLHQNRTLKEVNFSSTFLRDKGVIYVAAGLFKNQNLEMLHIDGNSFTGIGVEHLLCPLSKFSSLQSQANTTLKSLTFGGQRTKIGRNGLAAIVQMLVSNKSLTRLGILDDESLKRDDIVKIFKSMERNSTLRSLSLQGCKGVKGEIVLQTIMEILDVIPWIEEIDLARTPLHVDGKTDGIYQRLRQNERTGLVSDLLKDMPMTAPKSSRVFLCGQECVGKSALCNSISQNISPSKRPYMEQVRILVDPVEQAVRTPGIKIKILEDEGTKISIWNLAAQHHLYSLHDLMFPGHSTASLFLIISSFFRKSRDQKSPSEIEEDLHYWLRFIISNSRRAVQQCMLPNVTIVLTHHDKVNPQCDNLTSIISVIQKLREKWNGYVELYPTVFTVDARSSASVSKLSNHMQKTCKTILQRVPRIYQLCNDLMDVLQDWQSENGNKPTMKWNEFERVCQVKIPSLRFGSRYDNKENVEDRRRVVATCLHEIGELIYFQELGFLILDCEWFFGEVLSQLISLDVRKQSSTGQKNGFVCRKELRKILPGSFKSWIPRIGSTVFDNLEASDLVRMMLKLELCYEQDPSDPNSPILIPSNLEDGTWKPQRWQVNGSECNYVGRHLQCDDSSHMFLTQGFFPRLQVHLHNKIMGIKNQHGATYTLEKYLISINIHGIYVRIELGRQLGHYVDILACSPKSATEMLRLIQQLIIPAIHSLSSGITQTEYILRSESVKNLIPPRNRRNQVVPLQQLKQALVSVPADSIYDYQHTWDSVNDSSGSIIMPSGFDFARDLLSDDDFREVLHCRYHDLYNLTMELQVSQDINPDNFLTEEMSSSVEPTFAGIAKGVESVLQRLKIIEQEIRDVKQEIQGLRYYEHRLLIELHRKINYLVNYNTQVEERKVPNMLYFVETQNYSRRLITTVISGMNALRLHMLCEYRQEMHVVEDQIGCELMHVDNITVKCLAPYMTKFMKLLTFALKIGAHLAAGMGEMIPDLGKEVAHLVDSPMMYGVAAGAVGAAALGNRNRSESARDAREEHGAAQQWVMDFLRDQRCSTGKDIAEKFGLWRVRYRDDGQIAWICRRHMYTRANEIIEVPV